MDCAICGAPAEVEREWTATGVDYDGADAVFPMLKIRCAAGHWYTQAGDGISAGDYNDG